MFRIFLCICVHLFFTSNSFAQKGGMPTLREKPTSAGVCRGVDPEFARVERFLEMRAKTSASMAQIQADYVQEQSKIHRNARAVAFTSTALMGVAAAGTVAVGGFVVASALSGASTAAGVALVTAQAIPVGLMWEANLRQEKSVFTAVFDSVEAENTRRKDSKQTREDLKTAGAATASNAESQKIQISSGDIARSIMNKAETYNKAMQEVAVKTKAAMDALPQDKEGNPKFRWWTVGHDDKAYVEVLLSEAKSHLAIFEAEAKDMAATLKLVQTMCTDIKEKRPTTNIKVYKKESSSRTTKTNERESTNGNR